MEGEMLPAASTMGRGGALQQITRAQVDIQISTAQDRPRDVGAARKRIWQAALRDAQTAAECFYTLERENKKTGKKTPIYGPSVRLAEIVAANWGNLRAETTILEIGNSEVRVRGICHDLETNFALAHDVSLRITYRDGKRYSDDMIQTQLAAASSKAFRNAVLRVVPATEWRQVFVEAMKMQGKVRPPPAGQTPKDSRAVLEEAKGKCLEVYAEQGVTLGQLLAKVGKETWTDVTMEDLTVLRGVLNAITQEVTSIEEAFGEAEVPGAEETPPRGTTGRPGPAARPLAGPATDRQPGEE
jgi:hypothetical protein